jgi:hypothetical protein
MLQSPESKPPTREEILANIRQQNSGHLIEQIISLEADKAVLINELVTARRRISELEGPKLVEPTVAAS